MENEIRKPIYKRKILVIPVIALMCMAFAYAAVNYFHSIQVDMTVNEARSSVDVPFSLTFNSGETVTHDLTIHNAANVQLCAELTYNESSNVNGVTYTDNLPVTVTLAPASDTTQTVSFTADETTPAGAVVGNIVYTPIDCP